MDDYFGGNKRYSSLQVNWTHARWQAYIYVCIYNNYMRRNHCTMTSFWRHEKYARILYPKLKIYAPEYAGLPTIWIDLSFSFAWRFVLV